MGLTVLTIEVANPADLTQRDNVRFLIDSGAVYSFVPDGSLIERDRADAVFFYKDRRGAAPVIFGEPGDAVVLGATTLETLGFVLDAVHRELVPLPMVVGGPLHPST